MNHQRHLNPYAAGVMIGVTLLLSFATLGAGLSASTGIARFAAFLEARVFPDRVASSEYFGSWGDSPLRHYAAFMLLGILIGAAISAVHGGRFTISLERGAACPAWRRTLFAFCGGVVVAWGGRLAQGCTSGQALSGGALMLTGSLAFMLCLFAGGYAAAFFVRGQWHD